jgi:rubredoxin/ribosomal protein L40E
VYRESARPAKRPPGELVTVQSYADTVLAEADRAHLASRGITAHVVEALGFNPALANATGAVRLLVGERDAPRAVEILGAVAPEEAEDDDEGESAVRCPRCELAYCALERPRMHNAAPGLGFLALPFTMLFAKERWHCHKCGHAWDDPKEGPAAITKLEKGEPRPVFRLRRAHGGMGLFLGLGVGGLASIVLGGASGGLALLCVALAGALLGRSFRYDVCSVRGCRAPLPPGAEECPKCKGGIAGVVHTAEEHYAAAADFRRELAGLRNQARAKKKRKAARLATTTSPPPK